MDRDKIANYCADKMRRCEECGLPYWATLSGAQRNEIISAMWSMYRLFNRIVDCGTTLCDSCMRKFEDKQAESEFDEALRDHEYDRRVCKNFRQYLSPWREMRAANDHAWNIGESWSKTYSGHKRKNLYLYGPEGVGKTSLARYILGLAIRAGDVVFEVSCLDIGARGKSFDDARREKELEESSTVLLLDDLSSADLNSKDRLDALYSILGKRQSAGQNVIITTQESIVEFRDRVIRAYAQGDTQGSAESLVRRLQPMMLIKMQGESMRPKLGKEQGD